MEVILLTEEKIKSILNDVLIERNNSLLQRFKKEVLPDRKISVDEAAEQLGVIPLTIRNWLTRGFIKGHTLGRRIYILQSELDKALQEVKSLKYKRK